MPIAVCIPLPVSPTVAPGRIGGPSISPVMPKLPPAAWAIQSKHLKCA